MGPKTDYTVLPNKYQAALELSRMGFWVFPLLENKKTPAITDFANQCTRDPEAIKRFWVDEATGTPLQYNIGIYTGKFGDEGLALVAVDVDVKKGKTGDTTLLSLELAGKLLPETFTQATPSGGKHFIYWNEHPVKQGVEVLGPGIDIRSRGGYLVGYGSVLDGVQYYMKPIKVHKVPDWILEYTGRSNQPVEKSTRPIVHLDQARASVTATRFLQDRAELSIEGHNGDATAYLVACQVKDLGCEKDTCFSLMMAHWNHRCSPPWSPEELKEKVNNAYKYGERVIGADTPEVQFALPAPEESEIIIREPRSLVDLPAGEGDVIDRINSRYAFIILGGKQAVIHERKDKDGFVHTEFLEMSSFHSLLSSQSTIIGDKPRRVTEMWVTHPKRRTYLGLTFTPSTDYDPSLYNTWKGFRVRKFPEDHVPTTEAEEGFAAYLSHVKENICANDQIHYDWVMDWLASIIQNPASKSRVALVLQGKKGVGKNVFSEVFGHLLGPHFHIANDRRQILGNFNAHLESILFLVLDEAFWSGDKQGESKLKSLITGNSHMVERKGRDVYAVPNFMRLCIMGNDEWLAPATVDERRFAVFAVGEGRRNDKKYFGKILDGMKDGGYELLYDHLLNRRIVSDINTAPETEALARQKLLSLDSVEAWWHDCLYEGRIFYGDGAKPDDYVWPEMLDKDEAFVSYLNFTKRNRIGAWIHTKVAFGMKFSKVCPSVKSAKVWQKGWHYKLPSLGDCRALWEVQYKSGFEH